MPPETISNKTPRQLGYTFPAEFAPQRAMWLSWPHKEASWPGKIETIYRALLSVYKFGFQRPESLHQRG